MLDAPPQMFFTSTEPASNNNKAKNTDNIYNIVRSERGEMGKGKRNKTERREERTLQLAQ